MLVASNGREALEVMRTNRPQLILLDLMMPVLDGWEFVKELDKDPKLSDTPIVVITAYADRARPVPRSLRTLEKPVDSRSCSRRSSAPARLERSFINIRISHITPTTTSKVSASLGGTYAELWRLQTG